MQLVKPNFFRSKEFKLFVTIWIIYVFYLQMFGSSCMANSQSALTAAIVNELRFEVDTYSKVSCDLASYNGHYYSGMSPGISFISVPLYILSKPVFYILPQDTIEFLFKKLENYGNSLPSDLFGTKKLLSNYFSGLTKRQILEYVIISGFILPTFTTALISAISAVFLYVILRKFTQNERLRTLITLFYSFGTILFPKSTEFFQRPIAIAIAFIAFIILFKIRHKELELKGSTVFLTGMLAGLSGLFDYFHLFVAALLFAYLLSFLGKEKLPLLLKFFIGASIPILILLIYQYVVFDNLFGVPYYHRSYLQSQGSILDAYNQYIPSKGIPFSMVVFHILELFLYSPILLLASYGLYKALLKRGKYYHDAIAITAFVAFTFIFILGLVFFYHSGVGPSIKRYMAPIIPYLMIFLPYIFINSRFLFKENKVLILLLFLGIISIFANWISVQYGGHWALTHFDPKTRQFPIIAEFLENGPQSSFLNAAASVFNVTPLVFNLIGLTALILIILIIWKPAKQEAEGVKNKI